MNPDKPLPEGLHPDTLAVRVGIDTSAYGENSEALYLTSCFVQPDAATSARRFAGEEDGYTYSRTSNPSVTAFERRLAALEGAEAAMRDRDHIARCQSENARMRSWLAEALAEKGVPSDTSCANFILARFADAETAGACDDYLKGQGLIVRRVAGYGLPNCLRITVGDEASCRRVAHVIGQFMAERAERG